MVFGDFEWDSDKESANIAEHGVTFAQAIDVILDPLAVEDSDPTADEARVDTIGETSAGRVLFVVTIDRGARVRIISARPAEPHEVRKYRNRRE